LGAVLFLAAFPLVSDDLYFQNLLILTFLLAIGASGWNMMGGYAGYISLGNSAFIGLGAYTTGFLAVHHGISPFVGCLAGGMLAGIAAAVLSLVTRRTRGMYFVIVTFAALQLLGLVARNWSDVTGGSHGLAMPLPTWDLRYQNWPFYFSLLALLILTIATSAWVRRSKLGLGLFAIQDDEDRAEGLGIRTPVYKMLAFVLGSMFIGTAGGIYGYYVTFLDPHAMFDIVASVLMVLAALLGGRGTVWGPVLGAFILEPLAEFTNTGLGGPQAGAVRLIVFGVLLGAVVLFLPQGVLPTLARRFRRAAPPATQPRQAARSSAERGHPGKAEAAPALPTGSGDVLATRRLAKHFGGLHAVAGVDLTLRAGAVTGLIGPNGSGKTTLFNLLDGTVRPSSGQVVMTGRRIENRSRATRAHGGLARTYQLPRLFASLSVIENIIVPERSLSWRRLLSRRILAAEDEQARRLLDQLGLLSFADASPANLSYGQRKLLELAQALWPEPTLIMLDEPAAGISPAMSQHLTSMIRVLNSRGVSFLIVEHELAFMAELCDHVFVMANGAIIASGTVSEISRDAKVVDAYLGDTAGLLAVGHG
jgi:branched-chain amino acid transport system permease protein